MSQKLLLAVLATVVACGSTAQPPEAPLVAAEDEPNISGPKSSDGASPADMTPESPAAKQGPAKGKEDSIPDDYQLTSGDCDALGKQFGHAWRADEIAKLNPKLSGKQREQAEKSLDEGAGKAGDKFGEGCMKSLVGKGGDPKSLKCALDAKSVKVFDACLNGEAPAPKGK